MVVCETTYATATVVPNKGPDAFSVRFGVQFLQEFGYPRKVLKIDGEPNIIAWAVQREWAKEDTEQRQQLILRQSPAFACIKRSRWEHGSASSRFNTHMARSC